MRKGTQYVAILFHYRGQWREMSVTVQEMWNLIRNPEVTHLETV